jgi:uncharacterized phage protein gp47/JayE
VEEHVATGTPGGTAEYTKPKLRKRLKEEIQASDKGGRKGQWSARKSELKRAAQAESKFGKGPKTVLEAIRAQRGRI